MNRLYVAMIATLLALVILLLVAPMEVWGLGVIVAAACWFCWAMWGRTP